MPLIRDRTIKYNEASDLIREVERKARSGELGLTNEERMSNTLKTLNKALDSVEHALNKFITVNPAMIAVKARARLLYKRPEPVLITGSTGTGKELLARALTIPGEPFVAENCAAIPGELFESVFFGHVKGAFTGASDLHIGLLEEAGEGVIFLDEIGDMPLPMQAKFLRAIQENEIRRVGSTEIIDLNCRFIAATKYNIEERVDKGLFREDLFARLFTYQLRVTDLKDRPEDIAEIMKSLQPSGTLTALEEKGQWPFPEFILQKIWKYNVRAIEAANARRIAYNSYDE